ncbi:hypothetical protein ACHAW5_009642 [Stephanodiscus triporus]|uniref:Uncharacterized protein n=1 Tax=Stephanodiscus triporus TaxID=2934178 RepID=A0ABD3QBI2_9STRA
MALEAAELASWMAGQYKLLEWARLVNWVQTRIPQVVDKDDAGTMDYLRTVVMLFNVSRDCEEKSEQHLMGLFINLILF